MNKNRRELDISPELLKKVIYLNSNLSKKNNIEKIPEKIKINQDNRVVINYESNNKPRKIEMTISSLKVKVKKLIEKLAKQKDLFGSYLNTNDKNSLFFLKANSYHNQILIRD